MTSDEAVRLTRVHIESQFPKNCTKCGRRFGTLGEYLRETRHVGEPISYDVEEGDWAPDKPIGILAFANCRCGTTLAISSAGMPLPTLLRLMAWAHIESLRRGVTMAHLLDWVRAEIDRQVLSEPPGQQSQPG